MARGPTPSNLARGHVCRGIQLFEVARKVVNSGILRGIVGACKVESNAQLRLKVVGESIKVQVLVVWKGSPTGTAFLVDSGYGEPGGLVVGGNENQRVVTV